MNSYDRVRKIVQEEGRTARNLVIYNVPVEQRRSGSGKKLNVQILYFSN